MLVFFFKQKTAYEMRISDWSSDVCSSDLLDRYDRNLGKWVDSAVKNQVSLNFLNIGQGAIITTGVTVLLWLSADGVVKGAMTVGDVVLVSAYLTQLYAPLNFLGFVYREIKHALADMERMFDRSEEHTSELQSLMRTS